MSVPALSTVLVTTSTPASSSRLRIGAGWTSSTSISGISRKSRPSSATRSTSSSDSSLQCDVQAIAWIPSFICERAYGSEPLDFTRGSARRREWCLMRCVLAHDVGTTGDKATLYDEDGALLASAFVPYETSSPRVGWLEQSPQDWWRALCEATQALLRNARATPAEVAAVAFSGQMMGAVAVDTHVNPVRDAIIWADQRAVRETERVAERVDPRRVYSLTGHRLSPSYSAAKMLWIKENEPG